MVAVAGFSREKVIAAVQQMYTDVATRPADLFHFPTGRSACVFVGYPEAWLDRLPASALESFAGVGFPFSAEVIRAADHVLDLGAGSGTDTLTAARLTGPQGKIFALDMTQAMLAKLRRNAVQAGVMNVELIEANAETIPLPDNSVDVVTSNGVLNLVPDKPKAIAEIHRVLRPGGRAQIADIVVSQPVSESAKTNPKLWAECVVGAVAEEQYLGLFRTAGFANARVLRSFDYFSGSASAETRKIAAALGAKAVEIVMERR